MTALSVFGIADIQDRIDNLAENGTDIKPFVTTAISDSMAGGITAVLFLEYSEVVIDDGASPAIVCCWWRAIGTELQGSARVLVGEHGVLHQKIAYFSRLSD